MFEVTTHLREEDGDRQVDGAGRGMTHVGLGSSCAVHILERPGGSLTLAQLYVSSRALPRLIRSRSSAQNESTLLLIGVDLGHP
jgi:hypothetical protein